MTSVAMGQMRAILLGRDLKLSLGTAEVRRPEAGEVLVRVEYCGICGSDRHAIASGDWIEYWPAILGHEAVGVVEESVDPAIRIGERVVIDSRRPCEQCALCRRGARGLCESLTWMGESAPGGYAEYVVVPSWTLHRIPDRLQSEVAVLAEPLAVIDSTLDHLPATAGTVRILGGGPIGVLAALRVAQRFAGVEVEIVEVVPERVGLVRQLSVDAVQHSSGSRVDAVIDAAGYVRSVDDAFAGLTNGGTVIAIALGESELQLPVRELVEHGWSLVGSIGFEAVHLDRSLAALAEAPETYRGVVTEIMDFAVARDFLAGRTTLPGVKMVVKPSHV